MVEVEHAFKLRPRWLNTPFIFSLLRQTYRFSVSVGFNPWSSCTSTGLIGQWIGQALDPPNAKLTTFRRSRPRQCIRKRILFHTSIIACFTFFPPVWVGVSGEGSRLRLPFEVIATGNLFRCSAWRSASNTFKRTLSTT